MMLADAVLDGDLGVDLGSRVDDDLLGKQRVADLFGADEPEIVPSRKTRMPGGFNQIARPLFKRFSKDTKVPDWQRIAFWCWAEMRRDQHCPMAKGEIAVEVLGKPKMQSGKVSKAINEAIRRGWLAHGSNARCLVAPYDVQFHAGNHHIPEVCEFHGV